MKKGIFDASSFFFSSYPTKTMERVQDEWPSFYERLTKDLFFCRKETVVDMRDMPLQRVEKVIEHFIEYSRYETYVDEWTMTTEEGSPYVMITWTYERPKWQVLYERYVVKRKAQRILHQVTTEQMTTEEKVKALYTYVVTHFLYDEVLDECSEGIDTYGYHPSNTAYGVLTTKKGVCEGFARLFVILFDLLSIPNYYVVGRSEEEGHAWNLLKVNGRYVHFDVTDDLSTARKKEKVTYNYFLIDSSRVSHQWKKKQYPN